MTHNLYFPFFALSSYWLVHCYIASIQVNQLGYGVFDSFSVTVLAQEVGVRYFVASSVKDQQAFLSRLMYCIVAFYHYLIDFKRLGLATSTSHFPTSTNFFYWL